MKNQLHVYFATIYAVGAGMVGASLVPSEFSPYLILFSLASSAILLALYKERESRLVLVTVVPSAMLVGLIIAMFFHEKDGVNAIGMLLGLVAIAGVCMAGWKIWKLEQGHYKQSE